MHGDTLRLMRQRVQLIFQDPIASLNPRRRIGDIVAEPLIIAGVKDPDQTQADSSTKCSAPSASIRRSWSGRLPHEFSGGQCQRICIARALVLNPEFIVCDEPVSALDVSIRAQILNLLEEMKARYGLTLLFIAHDLAVVKAVSDRVAVMYLGRLCEVGPSEQLFAKPAHPYTALLIEAIPVPDPDVRPAETVPVGEPPSPIAPPSGCRFRTRCPRADQQCSRRGAGTSRRRTRPVRGLPSSADLNIQPNIGWARLSRSDERGNVRIPAKNKNDGRERDEEFPGRRVQRPPERSRSSDAGAHGHAGAAQGEGGRRLPQRSAYLGRRI